MTFPPGRRQAGNESLADRIGCVHHDDRDRRGRVLAARVAGEPGNDHVVLQHDQLSGEVRQPSACRRRIATSMMTFRPSSSPVAQALPE